MILAYAVIFLIVLALLLRRDLSAIGRTSYRGGWKLAVVVVILFVLHDTLVIDAAGQTFFQTAILISAQIGLTVILLLNHHLPGVKLFVLGTVLNTLVMAANGGWMPVTPETYDFVLPGQAVAAQTRPLDSKNIVLPRDRTTLWVLSDIIPVALPWRRYAVSVGDIFIVIGIAQFIFKTTSRRAAGNGPDATQRIRPG